MTSIPPPSYVAQVWLLGDESLAIHFPQANDGHGHTIYLSADVYGLTCMLRILQERQKDGPYTVGHESTPTQWQVDRAIRKIKLTLGEAPKVAKLSKEDREVLRRADETERRKAQKRNAGMELLQKLRLI